MKGTAGIRRSVSSARKPWTRAAPSSLSSRAPASPYRSHVLQLAAYCLLTTEAAGRRTPYGILHYADQTFEIPYTSQLEEELLDVLDSMHNDLTDENAYRNHDDPRRCAGCGHREHCEMALA